MQSGKIEQASITRLPDYVKDSPLHPACRYFRQLRLHSAKYHGRSPWAFRSHFAVIESPICPEFGTQTRATYDPDGAPYTYVYTEIRAREFAQTGEVEFVQTSGHVGMWRYAKDASATTVECISQDCVQWNKFLGKKVPKISGSRDPSGTMSNVPTACFIR